MKSREFSASFASDGGILQLQAGEATFRFREDEYAGPAWTLDGERVPLTPVEAEPRAFAGTAGGMEFGMRSKVEADRVVLQLTLRNPTGSSINNIRAGILLGVDMYMSEYPAWNERLFPTLIRCEKTHLWGYLMGPTGQILLVAVEDPVASYHLHYKPNLHRIYTGTLDLMHPSPLPSRHPEGLDCLGPGEERIWTLHLMPLEALEEVKQAVASVIDAPVLDAELYTVDKRGLIRGRVLCGASALKKLTIVGPDGVETPLDFSPMQTGGCSFTHDPGDRIGLYRVTAVTANGKRGEAMFAVRHEWSWYLKQARRNAQIQEQKGGSHTESWYGLYSAALARKYFPDPELDQALEDRFLEIWPIMYDMETRKPTSMHSRIQNHACAAGLFAARYRATGDIRDLEWAASLADFIVDAQGEDGGYYAVYGEGEKQRRVHYTCVAYLAKSLMEVVDAERGAGDEDPEWRVRADWHMDSVHRAVRDLALRQDNIETEGEMTFEDGMISCSYTQLAMYALHHAAPEEKATYVDAAQRLRLSHRCLSQLLIPDCRMNGGTLRFWESQYDILTPPNMMNSPHGWTAWRVYGLWYLYQLTGREELLSQVYNTLGAGCQLIDFETGELQWAFVVDPYVEADRWLEDPVHPGRGMGVPEVVGEQYLPMVSGWYKAPPNTWAMQYGRKQDGGACDNDVHETFKCLEETVLTTACVVERPNGVLVGYNCSVEEIGGVCTVKPQEDVVMGVHVNLKRGRTVRVLFGNGGVVEEASPAGMKWIRVKVPTLCP